MRLPLVRPALLALFALLLAPAAAQADPVVITSGVIRHGDPTVRAGYNFDFSGDGLSARTGDERLGNNPPQTFSCFVCAPGQTYNATFNITFFTGASITLGSATVDGTTYPNVWFAGSLLTINVAPVALPSELMDTVTVTTTFTFDATLVGSSPTGVPLFSRELTGHGTAALTFIRAFDSFTGTVGYRLSDARYDFAPAAVPEPATLALLAAGLGGVALRARRRRAARQT